jgi:hypothetical protein
MRGGPLSLRRRGKVVQLEVMARSQPDKITELEATCTDLKHQKDKLTHVYQSLAQKH